MKVSISTFVFIIFCVLANPVYAIVNMEDVHLKSNKQGITGNTSLTFSGAKGNSDYFSLDWKSRLQVKDTTYTRYAQLQYSYGESFSKENHNSAFVHLRNIQHISALTSWELFAQAEQNRFSRLKLRALLGSGVRWDLSAGDSQRQLYFGTGAFYTYESIDFKEQTDDAGKERNFRGNFYLLMQQALTDNTYIQSTTYFQPAIDNLKDYRLLEVFGLKIDLNKALSISMDLELSHDNRPPQLVEKSDISYKSGIVYQFY